MRVSGLFGAITSAITLLGCLPGAAAYKDGIWSSFRQTIGKAFPNSGAGGRMHSQNIEPRERQDDPPDVILFLLFVLSAFLFRFRIINFNLGRIWTPSKCCLVDHIPRNLIFADIDWLRHLIRCGLWDWHYGEWWLSIPVLSIWFLDWKQHRHWVSNGVCTVEYWHVFCLDLAKRRSPDHTDD
ncbi:uncharacterized protein B0H64DRAFT_370744 [Chaetomium fimeti]|uniref:Uncharacterized protein n=1 Tax=Chaetomium fimeti TaxID=1854472 RepID=A0AAE0LVC4_9PEZI|nr:hypothetical protein B0H64DRAFT_370744 [Chaetomium fimeti]